MSARDDRSQRGWLRRWLSESGRVERDLSSYDGLLEEVRRREPSLLEASDDMLHEEGASLRRRAREGVAPDALLPEAAALFREIAHRQVGLRPFDVQIIAGAALLEGRVVEMQTGEGKTLAAVLPAILEALGGEGVHLLTFNDYLATRDAAWMGPIYRAFGLRVAALREGMGTAERAEAYGADVTYGTAREAGFDLLRDSLVRRPEERAQRPFHFAIVDEADSILIDEARIPLVIAGQRESSETSLSRIADVVRGLEPEVDWERDHGARNVFLTELGWDHVEEALDCGDLHDEESYLLLTEVSQALHAHVLLERDVDYIVRDGQIEIVDEFTGRVVDDRRWPDGLQAAVEAKEGLSVRLGGRILGSITLQHDLELYPKLAGMTATAVPSAEELEETYGLKVVVIPPNQECCRIDRRDVVFSHREAKHAAMVEVIAEEHERGRPVLVGTGSVEESEALATSLRSAGLAVVVLNAKNDEAEAAVIADAGALGALTISTNMAGRGTDIRLGGEDEATREQVLELGGLLVLGTTRHESARIDDQLRGRAGRQGDPGESQFFISLEDPLMVRFGLEELVPKLWWPPRQRAPVENPVIRRAIARLQRIVEGQNADIRRTLLRYTTLLERQRRKLRERRQRVLACEADALWPETGEAQHRLEDRLGVAGATDLARAVGLAQIDRGWEEHLAWVSELREGIHLIQLSGGRPIDEFHRQIDLRFRALEEEIGEGVVETLSSIDLPAGEPSLEAAGLIGPSSTWTYLVDDRALGGLEDMLAGSGNYGVAAAAALTTGPLLAAWALWRWITGRPR